MKKIFPDFIVFNSDKSSVNIDDIRYIQENILK